MAKPDHMCSVIGKVIPCFGMREDGQAVPVQRRPESKCAKAFCGNGQLAATARMWTHRPVMKPADSDAEHSLRLAGEGLSGFQFVGVKINVRVEILNLGHQA